jgi:hypothetical protein
MDFLDGALDGDKGVRDVFDEFLAELATYARAGDLLDGTHYAFVGGKLCIHLPGCYQVYLVQRGRAGRKDGANGLPALRRIIDEKHQRGGYVTRKNHRVRLGGASVRTIEIDPALIPEHLDIDDFPSQNHRQHGGPRTGFVTLVGGYPGGDDGGEPDLTADASAASKAAAVGPS